MQNQLESLYQKLNISRGQEESTTRTQIEYAETRQNKTIENVCSY